MMNQELAESLYSGLFVDAGVSFPALASSASSPRRGTIV